MRLCLLTLLIASLLTPLFAPAAEPVPKKGNTLKLGNGKAGGKLLTRDQLRRCLSQQEGLKTQNGEMAKTQAGLEADKTAVARATAELDQQEMQLKAERDSIDATQEAAVTAFNVKLKQREDQLVLRNKLVDAYNAKLAPFNAEVQVYTAANETWQGECAGREYDELDYFAIQRGK